MIVEQKIELRIDEVVLRDRAFEVLVSYGVAQNHAMEMAMAIVKDARKHSTIYTTRMTTGENVEPPKGGPYR